jgi:hypothetical protein
VGPSRGTHESVGRKHKEKERDSMKSISVKSGVLLLTIGLIFNHAEVWGADWCYYGTQEDIGQFFYDKDSMTTLPEGFVRVRVRAIKDEDLKKAIEEKKEATQKFIEGKLSGKKSVSKEIIEKMYEEWQKEFLRDTVIAEKRMLIELKCGGNMFRMISGIEVDEKGSLKNAFSTSQAEWLPIYPETPVGGLYNTVCPKPE